MRNVSEELLVMARRSGRLTSEEETNVRSCVDRLERLLERERL